MILPNYLQTLPRFTTDKAAWTWIARELCEKREDSVLGPGTDNGLCIVLRWMRVGGMISFRLKERMIDRLYDRFRPQWERGERSDGPFYWKRGVREPRVMAAQLMAILPVPRARGR